MNTRPHENPGVNTPKMYCNRINQTTFGCDQGQILTTFDEGVNADAFSLSFLSHNAKTQQIPGTVRSLYIPEESLFFNCLELSVNVSGIQLIKMYLKAK